MREIGCSLFGVIGHDISGRLISICKNHLFVSTFSNKYF